MYFTVTPYSNYSYDGVYWIHNYAGERYLLNGDKNYNKSSRWYSNKKQYNKEKAKIKRLIQKKSRKLNRK